MKINGLLLKSAIATGVLMVGLGATYALAPSAITLSYHLFIAVLPWVVSALVLITIFALAATKGEILGVVVGISAVTR